MLFIKVIILVGLIRLLLVTEQPFLCSGIYAGLGFVLSLASGYPFPAVLLGTAISFALASLYFWLLNRFTEAGLIWWVILIGGLLIGLV